MILISSSVINAFLTTSLPRILKNTLESQDKPLEIGEKTTVRNIRDLATLNANFSLCMPYALGIASPKTTTSNVITAVAIPTPIFPNKDAATTPASIEAVIFTKLLQITIELIISPGFFNNFSIITAFFSPELALLLTFILSTETKAISAAAKNEEKKIKRPVIKIIIIQIMFISLLFHLI